MHVSIVPKPQTLPLSISFVRLASFRDSFPPPHSRQHSVPLRRHPPGHDSCAERRRPARSFSGPGRRAAIPPLCPHLKLAAAFGNFSREDGFDLRLFDVWNGGYEIRPLLGFWNSPPSGPAAGRKAESPPTGCPAAMYVTEDRGMHDDSSRVNCKRLLATQLMNLSSRRRRAGRLTRLTLSSLPHY